MVCDGLVVRGVWLSVGCDGLVCRVVGVLVGCGERMVRTLGNSVGVAISRRRYPQRGFPGLYFMINFP